MNSQSALSTSSLTLSLVRRGVGRGRCGRGGIVRKHTYVKCSKYYHGRHCRGHCFTENTDAASIQPAPSSSTATHAGPPVAAVSVGVCVRISDTYTIVRYVCAHTWLHQPCMCMHKKRDTREGTARSEGACVCIGAAPLTRRAGHVGSVAHTTLLMQHRSWCASCGCSVLSQCGAAGIVAVIMQQR